MVIEAVALGDSVVVGEVLTFELNRRSASRKGRPDRVLPMTFRSLRRRVSFEMGAVGMALHG